MAKPRVNAKSILWLMRIWEGIERGISNGGYWRSDYDLKQAPSDILDGWAYPHELADLVRRRILHVIPVERESQNGLSTVTWGFTPRGIAIMRAWKANVPAALPDVQHAAHCCANCGAPLDEQVV